MARTENKAEGRLAGERAPSYVRAVNEQGARAHCQNEPPLDLKKLLRDETGRDIVVDQDEITNIVLCRRIWPTTIDADGLRKTWSELHERVIAAEAAFSGPGIVREALDRIVQDARSLAAA